jgi:lipoprotein NlpI
MHFLRTTRVHSQTPHLCLLPLVLFQAIECFIGASEISPKDANIYSKLGLNYGKNGQLELAMEAFDTALALDPTHTAARSNKAVALERMGKQEVSVCCDCASLG